MDTQGYTGQLDHGRNPLATRASGLAGGRLALMALLIGGAVGAALGWSVNQASTPIPVSSPQTAAAPVVQAPKSSAAGLPGRQSLVVAIPEERAYVKSSSIAVAGMAFSRPHGPRIRSVQVELYVGDRLVEQAEFEVFSSRFAGVLQLSTAIGRADAELRVSDPNRKARPIVVRHLTIDARG